jgi:pilus assembly protein CpaB
MSKGTRTLIVLVVALGAALGASWWMYRTVQSLPVRQVEVASVQYAVASKSLPLGTRLTANDVTLVAWPARNPVDGGFTSVEKVVDRGLLANVVKNEPITESKLAPIEAGAGLSPTIPQGMRAISVKVNEVIGVAGFVVPGTRVDVVVTLSRQEESSSRVVLTNVEVLTAGTRYDQEKAKNGEPIQTAVVTLLVTPEDAEKVALAGKEGSIVLALRNPLDTAPTSTTGVRLASLLGPADPPPVTKVIRGERRVVPAPPPPEPAPRAYTVETIRAAKRANEVVK